MVEFDFAGIEKKWQRKWKEGRVFEVDEKSKKKKFYVLEMFPYPSGAGLHMGHAWNYTIGDILARFKIMQGFNVLHPMGLDSLGLPAENAAIKAGEHPMDYTKKSIANFTKQFKALGLSYDWSRTVNTSDSSYYRWDQWIFLKMLEKGLAYQKVSAVNWCKKCNTVLANEQVHDGKCWRHGDVEVEVRHLKQWFLKTTEYADELYEGLGKMDWPERTKAMQRNWIGKSHGTEIDFVVGEKESLATNFTDEHELGRGISNVVIVHGSPSRDKRKDKDYIPENNKHWIPWLEKQLIKKGINYETPLMPTPWRPKYKEWKKEFEKIKIDENSVLVGHSAGGAFIVRWLGETRKKIRKLILIAAGKTMVDSNKRIHELYTFDIDRNVKNHVKDIIIFISNNEPDYRKKSAKTYKQALDGKLIELKNRGHFCKGDGVTEFLELFDEILTTDGTDLRGHGNVWKIFTTRPDTIFGVTFMVVAAQHAKLDSLVTSEQRGEVDGFLKKLKSVSEKDFSDLEKEGVFTGSYAVNPANGEKIPVWVGNFVVADYGAGMVMAVPAHDQRDFEFAKKYDIPIKEVVRAEVTGDRRQGTGAFVGSGKIVNSGEFDGVDSVEAKVKITSWLAKKKVGRKVVNFKLRDWGISRQRYWGTPIPVVHCEKCGVVAVAEKDLPVVLPKDIKFGKGNPLETNEKWLNVKCPKCGGKGRRESDTMDTFVNSSWYFLRYCDSKNTKNIFDVDKVKYWCPVDSYIGGAEHACMHLIYSRFYVKFLRDLGLIDFDEPALRLFHQGMLHGADGEKMSKSKGNGVLPEEVSDKYGIDTARFFLSGIASPDKDIDWSEKGILGSLRFVKKVIGFYERCEVKDMGDDFVDSAEVLSKLNETIRDVGEMIESFDYRAVTIRLRELFDLMDKEDGVSKDTRIKALKLLAPFCPHVCEEIWESLRGDRRRATGDRKNDFISTSSWPKADNSKTWEEKSVSDLNGKIVEDIRKIVDKFPNKKNVYVYVMPFEIGDVDVGKISKEIGKDVKVFAVNDFGKYDPEGKAKRAKPGKVAVYVE